MSEPNELILYTTADSDLEREATVALFATVQIEGSREVEHRIEREAVVANRATTAAEGKIYRVDSYPNGGGGNMGLGKGGGK
ncbi:MAG TPA: hypothetical protein PLA50_15240 [Bacteroidia bacterium]|nr:hypothetical protein [Bacteroidia bacterium]